jgi:hypothetical protein
MLRAFLRSGSRPRPCRGEGAFHGLGPLIGRPVAVVSAEKEQAERSRDGAQGPRAGPGPSALRRLGAPGCPALSVQASVQGSRVPLATARLLCGADPGGPG